MSSLIADLRDRFVYALVRLFICVVQAAPMETCAHLSRWLAWLASDVVRLRQGVVLSNLERAFPEYSDEQRRRLAQQMWRHLFSMVCEIAHVPRKVRLTNYRRYISLRQENEMVESMLDLRPRVMVTGHFGNFEVGGFLLGLFGFPTFSIARPLDNRYLHEFVGRFRGYTGQFILPKQGSAGDVQRVLEANETIALLGDQYAGPKGCWVEFFGQPTSSHKAVALFPLSSRAQMLVTHATRRGDRPMQFEMAIEGTLEPEQAKANENVRSVSQWYLRMLETAVRRAPEQYWWVHRIWKGEPPKRRRKKAA